MTGTVMAAMAAATATTLKSEDSGLSSNCWEKPNPMDNIRTPTAIVSHDMKSLRLTRRRRGTVCIRTLQDEVLVGFSVRMGGWCAIVMPRAGVRGRIVGLGRATS
jgi:hypothetical protein